MKLIPLLDFVLEQKRKTTSETDYLKPLKLIFNYAEFLKQPLTLGMFVPCDLDGCLLNVPAGFEDYLTNEESLLYAKNYEYIHEYVRAKEKVLFKNITVRIGQETKAIYINGSPTVISDLNIFCIEDIVHHKFELTPSALEAIGIKE